MTSRRSLHGREVGCAASGMQGLSSRAGAKIQRRRVESRTVWVPHRAALVATAAIGLTVLLLAVASFTNAMAEPFITSPAPCFLRLGRASCANDSNAAGAPGPQYASARSHGGGSVTVDVIGSIVILVSFLVVVEIARQRRRVRLGSDGPSPDRTQDG